MTRNRVLERQQAEHHDSELELAERWHRFPSAPTLFRTHLLGWEAEETLVQSLREVRPELWERDRGVVDQIEGAATTEALLDLVPLVTGMAVPAWRRRVAELSPEDIPLLVARLRAIREAPSTERRDIWYEYLIGALRWQGEAGAAALLECLADLDDYGKSLACVVLGQLGATSAGATIWGFFQSVKEKTDESHFVGPLWGLVDLGDARAADGLEQMLWAGCFFHEAPAMAHKVGDARVLLPIMQMFIKGDGEFRDMAGWAMVSIAHRIGREALEAQIHEVVASAGAPQDLIQMLVDRAMQAPQEKADTYFAPFYQGLSSAAMGPEQVQGALEAYGVVTGPQPHVRLGRNDLCWCGSGKKYKNCHWKADRQR